MEATAYKAWMKLAAEAAATRLQAYRQLLKAYTELKHSISGARLASIQVAVDTWSRVRLGWSLASIPLAVLSPAPHLSALLKAASLTYTLARLNKHLDAWAETPLRLQLLLEEALTH